jgi:large subunit ribosomal protein L22
MAATRIEEQLGTRAVLRYCRMSAFKVRPVLDLIRGRDLDQAQDILRFSERDAARVVAKLLASAVANAENNDAQSADELYVSACYADEGTTMKRWRPRARGRATRIRKRTCHITVVVTRLPEDRLARRQAKDTGDAAGRRARRVAGARKRAAASRTAEAGGPESADEAAPIAEAPKEATPEAEAPQEEAVEPDAEAEAAQDEAPEPEGDEAAGDGGQENDEKEKRK